MLAHLRHLSIEVVIGESIDGERHTLAFLHTTDVSLVDVGDDAHVRQVLGDGKELRRVERGSHRLAFLYRLRQHHAVNRTGDGCIAEVGLRTLHALLGGLHLLLGLVVLQKGALVLVGRDQSLVVERLIPIIIRLLIVQRTLCRRQVGTLGRQLTDEVGLVELGNDLTFLHH